VPDTQHAPPGNRGIPDADMDLRGRLAVDACRNSAGLAVNRRCGSCLGFGINGNGEVVGRSYLNKVFFFPCGRHTCRFTQNDPFSCSNGTMTHLGTFSATSMSEANAVSVRVGLTSDSAADRRSWWVTGSRTMDALYRKRGPPSATLSGRARRVGTFASTGEGFRHLGPLTPRLCGGTMAGGGATRP
jgi:hypothetical protein